MTIFNAPLGNLHIPWLSNEDIGNTLFLILIALIGRFLLVRMIKGRGGVLSDTRRRWISVVQNSTILFLVLGLIFIWSPQLSTFALSLTAFAVALVVATKEYILCVVGAIYRATSNPFAVGDWIEIQNLRGEVLTEGILTTKLQELGTGTSRFRFTGRILTIPNSVLLIQTVHNEHFRKHYLHHTFKVTVEPSIDPVNILKMVQPLLQSTNEDKVKKARQSWTRLRNKMEIELPSTDPRVSIETTDVGKISFIMTVFCTPQDAMDIEMMVTQKILSEVAKMKEALESTS